MTTSVRKGRVQKKTVFLVLHLNFHIHFNGMNCVECNIKITYHIKNFRPLQTSQFLGCS